MTLVEARTASDTFNMLHIDAKELRSGRAMRQQIKKHLIPRSKEMRFVDVRRSDIARLPDDTNRGRL
jgi:hypothetical protein